MSANSSDSSIVKLGRIMWIIMWVLVFANIAYDWLSCRWISPLSVIFLLVLGASLIMWLRGIPIITTKGWKTRAVLMVVFILATVAGVMIYLVFRILLR